MAGFKLRQRSAKEITSARETRKSGDVNVDCHFREGVMAEGGRAHVIGLYLAHAAQRLNGVVSRSDLIDFTCAEEDRPSFTHSRIFYFSDVGHFFERVLVLFEWLSCYKRRVVR